MATLSKTQRFGHWVWILERRCNINNHTVRLVAGDTRRPPQYAPGAIRCPYRTCDGIVRKRD